ncbi:hypothetical protein HORIV_29490 [Vreelandella olivaria]|uniref:Uncharacterized protein n=1 Tax=Vreelandella olivaria TaxID=390919 RepID=A0ABM7GIN7_9GAMM|nr:hypothetical protein HORIV_29490 [Halomonas olivaria]
MSWMVWTVPTAIFFSSIAAMLAGMTVWEILSPTIERKGFYPLPPLAGIGCLSACSLQPLSIWE